jgi:shikimate dehydrogenase
VVRALALAGAEVAVVARDPARAAVAAAVAPEAPGAVRVADHSALAGSVLVVNATPVGMRGPQAGQLPLDPAVLRAAHVVVDLVYDPLETPLLAAARARGAAAYDGLGMLVCQAARAFTLWTGHDAPLEAMFAAVRRQLASRSS